MILYYAMGGGLGHLTRGCRVLEALGITSDACFLTASHYADDVRVTGEIPVLRVPPELEHDVDAHRTWLRTTAADADRIIVDTFPAGIQGELCDLGPPMELVARSLRWDAYRNVVSAPIPDFVTIWTVEPLEAGHEAALRSNTASWRALSLQSEPLPHTSRNQSDPYWLVVHSGPEEEVRELVAHTVELRRLDGSSQPVLVATRCVMALPPGFERIDAYPVVQLFARATRIITAAGFNIMLETEPWAARHHPIPFPRRFDDQFARAARRRNGVLVGFG